MGIPVLAVEKTTPLNPSFHIFQQQKINMGDIDEGKLKEAFNKFDADGNGHIDRKEMKNVLLDFGLDDVGADRICNNCFEDGDFDNDNKITFDEFKKGVMKK